MDEQTARMIQQLKSNPAMLQALMQSRDGQALMEVKTSGGMPFWLSDVLCALGVYPTSFSKYGAASRCAARAAG